MVPKLDETDISWKQQKPREGFDKDIQIMIPDDEYNHRTFQFWSNLINGENRALSPRESEYNAKYGRVAPLMNVV